MCHRIGLIHRSSQIRRIGINIIRSRSNRQRISHSRLTRIGTRITKFVVFAVFSLGLAGVWALVFVLVLMLAFALVCN